MINFPNLNLEWWEQNIIVLDLEGTGGQHKEQEGIVEVAAIQIIEGHLSDNYFYKLINPEISIPPMISDIHGLKNQDLENKPIFKMVKPQLLDYLNNKILLGHNVNVDYRLLKLKMPEYAPALILDTKKLSKHFWPAEKKHALDDLIERFQIQDGLNDLPIKRGRHSAFYDAYATGLVFLEILQEKFLETTTLQEVADICSISTEIAKPEITKKINRDDQPTLF